MASTFTVAHRFANKDYNFERGLKGSSVHIDGKNYYSYSTVFGQWVDEKVCIVYQGDTSVTSHKHQLGSGVFPKDVVILPYDDGGSYYYGWHGCDLLGYSEEFKLSHRWRLMDYWMSEIYAALETIKGGKKKDLDSHARHAINEYWPYMEKLCSLYKDTTIPKYLKRCDKNYKKLVKALKDGEREVSTLVDLVFGEGTWQAYYDYCGRYRKSADKRAKVEALCKRLGIASPYESSWRGGRLDSGLTADQIRSLSAKERNDLHFASIMREESRKTESAVKEKYNKNNRNAYKWIVGYEPRVESQWSERLSSGVEKVRNMWTGDEYIVSEEGFRSHSRLWGLKMDCQFDYDKFRNSADKEEWIRNFYAECIEIDRNLCALHIFDRFNDAVYTDQLIDYSTYRIYVINDVLREGTTEKELTICEDFVNRWNAILHDKQARYRAEQMERERRKEEERKEKEYREQVKQEQIQECVERGADGMRDLWRLHLTSVYDAERTANSNGVDDDFFYYGGNVLLRLNLDKDTVETSKNIRIPVEICKKMWKIVSKWHENPACFKSMQIDTKGSGKYTISSYKNDILTAGCHDIAYAEMEHMYNEIVKLESEAA